MRLCLLILLGFVSLTIAGMEISTEDARMLKRFRKLQATEPAKAETMLKEALKKNESTALRYELGLFYASQEKQDLAIAEFDGVWKADPEFPGAGRNLSILLMKAERYPEALRVMSHMAKRRDLGAELTLLQGKAYTVTGNHLAALQCFREALPAYPDQLDLRLKIADTLYKLGRYDEASSAAKDVTRTDGSQASAWVIRGNCYLKLGNASAAIDCLEAARLLNPGLNNRLLPVLGGLYLSLDLPELAAERYSAAGSATIRQQLALARAFYNDNDIKRSRKLIDAVLKTSPDSADAQLLSGLLANKDGNIKVASTVLTAYVKQHPLDGEALVTLAEIAVKQKQRDQAVSWYRAARQSEQWRRYAMESELELYLVERDRNRALAVLNVLKADYPSPQWEQLAEELRRDP